MFTISPDASRTTEASPARRRFRRAAPGTLACLCVLGGASFFFSPKSIFAESHVQQARLARDASHQAALDAIASMTSRSVEVLAIHERERSPQVEIVLWISDARNPGAIDADELVVVSHSRLLRTITMYLADSSGTRSSVGWLISREEATRPGFCDRWRANPLVAGRVMATGVQHVRARWNSQAGSGSDSARPLEIALTWPADLVDGPDEASTVVDARWTAR